jgi:hypothetical protein
MAKKEIQKASPAASTAITKLDDELAKYAKDISSKETPPAGNFIGIKGGEFNYGGASLGTEVEVAVLDVIYENQFYTEKFDPDNPTPPDCYALAREEDGMAPHPESAKPQSDTCAKCPHNQWGTADRGRGKACKNMRRLALVSMNGLKTENVETAEAPAFRVSVTSVNNWKNYLTNILGKIYRKPPFAVVTKMTLKPDPKTQHKIEFEYVDALPADLLPGMISKYQKFTEADMLAFPYSKPAEKPAAAPKTKRKY